MQGFNKYYPPDYDPDKHTSLNAYHGKHALGKRAHKVDQGILVVRFELPYNIWCGTCNSHIGQGVRYNAEKQKVGNYHSTTIWAFRFKCHLCQGRIEIRTDPQNTRYVVTEGAKQKNEEWDAEDNGHMVIDNAASTSTAPPDPFASLEKTVTQKARALSEAERLHTLEAHNSARWSDPFAASRALRASFRTKKARIVASEKKAEGVRERFGLADERVALEALRTPARGSTEAEEEAREWEKARGEMERVRSELGQKRRRDEESVGWRTEAAKDDNAAKRRKRASADGATTSRAAPPGSASKAHKASSRPRPSSSSSSLPRSTSAPSALNTSTSSSALKALHSKLSLATALKRDPFAGALAASSSPARSDGALSRSGSVGAGLAGVKVRRER
ncbi:Protein saf4 [Rhodotorula kratochvilovae]